MLISDRWYPSYTLAFYDQIARELETIKVKEDKNMTLSERRKKERMLRNDAVQEIIESGDMVHVRYVTPWPDGDGSIHYVKGRVVSQDEFYMFVRRLHSGKVRVLKNQMFMVSHCVKRNKRRKPGKTKDMDMIGL